MGCAGSKSNQVNPDKKQTGGAPPAVDTNVTGDDFTKKFHSMVRWGKDASELEPFLAKNPEGKDCKDPKNGNYPIHIAAQNGHIALVRYLVCDKKCDLNAQNGTGQTALHMARAYDYYWCAKILLDNGADGAVKNQDDKEANSGIDGDKSPDDWLPAMISAHNAEELSMAMAGLKAQDPATIDKGGLAFAGNQKKKSDKALWTEEVNKDFKFLVTRD